MDQPLPRCYYVDSRSVRRGCVYFFSWGDGVAVLAEFTGALNNLIRNRWFVLGMCVCFFGWGGFQVGYCPFLVSENLLDM